MLISNGLIVEEAYLLIRLTNSKGSYMPKLHFSQPGKARLSSVFNVDPSDVGDEVDLH